MTNQTGITPLKYRILVKPVPPDDTTKGGIIKPDMLREREQAAAEIGELIAIGEIAFTMGTPSPRADGDFFCLHTRPEPGQRITYGRYAGAAVIGADGVEYRIMNDDDVTSILEDANGDC